MFVLNGNTEKIVGLLKKCGLTEYESKAYFTLLLTDRASAWELSKKSSVPNSKVYLTVENLKGKGLVEIIEEFPKMVLPEPFEPYLSMKINEKQREISELIETGNLIREIIYSLRPVAIRYKDKYCVFEPKYRRKT